MSRTERDVMRGKRIAIYAATRADMPGDVKGWDINRAAEQQMRVDHVYQHYCSPYCLIHWKKHYDRKVYRQHVKSALREARWDDARHLRPKHLR